MPTSHHAGLAAGRWHALTLLDQLANVGSEVERALRAREQGRKDRMEHAVARALELFDLTASDERWRGPGRRETLRAREYFCHVVLAEEADVDSIAFLRRYFLQFAVAARLGSRH